MLTGCEFDAMNSASERRSSFVACCSTGSCMEVLVDNALQCVATFNVGESPMTSSGPVRRRETAPFRISDLVRAVRAVEKLGLRVAKAEFGPDGQFNLIFETKESSTTPELDLVALARRANG